MVTRAALALVLVAGACGDQASAVPSPDAAEAPDAREASPADASPAISVDANEVAPPPPPPPSARTGSTDCAAGRWIPRSPAGLPPSWPHARQAFGAAWDTGRQLLFIDGGYPSTRTQHTMEWHEASGTWSDRSRDDGYGPRSGHSLAYDGKVGRFLAWGGGYVDGPWEWRPLVAQWKNLDPLSTSWTRPSPRSSAAAAFDAARDRFVISGGYAERDTWEWDLAAHVWEQKTRAPPTELTSLTGHAMVYDSKRERVYLLGNRDAGRDVWQWDPARSAYTALPSSGPSPLPRDWVMVAYDSKRDRVMLFGGYLLADGAVRNDLWEWNPQTAAWTHCNGDGPRPPARMSGALVFDTADETLVLFGGEGQATLADLWEWYIP